MIGGPVAQEVTATDLFPSAAGALAAAEVEQLWALVVDIHRTWGDPATDPLHFRSQWLEFVETRAAHDPSYLEEYRSAIRVLAELRKVHAGDAAAKLFFEHGTTDKSTRLGHLRAFVVEEFIKVWLAAGGFHAYGAANYNGYVSGSRFAVLPSYRRAT